MIRVLTQAAKRLLYLRKIKRLRIASPENADDKEKPMLTVSKTRPTPNNKICRPPSPSSVTIAALTAAEQAEALEFLAVRPLHTVIMSGWIRDHGVISPLHRGTFYGCRNSAGEFVGIALIGKHTLFEARTNAALTALAQRARACPNISMFLAESDKLAKFWCSYAMPGQPPRLTCRELLLELRQAVKDCDTLSELRLATENDLEQVAAVHAQIVLEETGVDPLALDPTGFRRRCAARIAQGRVWVWIKDGELIFKTDVVSETPEAVYIEGLWINPSQRGKGLSKLCLASLCRKLLNQTNAICGFVDAENFVAQALYRKVGFSLIEGYAKIYV